MQLFNLFGDLFFFAAYISSPRSFPEPLPPSEEKRLIALMAEGDDEARQKLIEHNLRLVAYIARKYAKAGRDSDDIISIGTIGLIKAVSTYDVKKGVALSSYASRCVENEILMSIRAEKRQVSEVSLYDSIGTDSDGNDIALSDILGTDADCVLDAVESSLDRERIKEAMRKTLTERERRVLSLRYGLDGGYAMTQREIARKLDISRSYISRIEKKALAKMTTVMQKD